MMIEKDLAFLAFELIGLLTKIFQKNKITLDVFLTNTMLKVCYLEEYIKRNEDSDENTRITQLLAQYNKIKTVSCPSSK